MSFHYPILFWSLPLILVIALYFHKLITDKSYRIKVWLLALVVVLMVTAFAKPYKEAGLVDVEIEGTEIVIAVDLSASMKGEDLKPNRLEQTKQLLKQLINHSAHDKFAILGFTSSSIILSTMTDDKNLLLELFDRLDNTNIVSKSTSLMPVLELASKLSQIEHRQLLLFTDGGERGFAKEIEFAKKEDLAVFVVGTATNAGVALKQEDGSFLLNKKEEIVVSSLNAQLKDLCVESGGSFFSFDTAMSDVLESIQDHAQDQQKSESKERLEQQLFYYFLIAALLLFMVASTSLVNLFVLLALLMPMQNYAAMTDFYHIDQGAKAFKNKDYETATGHYEALEDKNWQTLFNLGNSYFKEGSFGLARTAYGRIKTKDAKLKAKLYHNIGNCYVREGTFKKAQVAYRKSLALFYDKTTAENLVWTLDKFDNMRSPKTHQAKNMIDDPLNQRANQAGNKQKKKAGSKSQLQQGEAKSGAGGTKMQDKKKKQTPGSAPAVGLSPKQYQLINKGSTYEKNPW